ncbi:MAG: hypothetical protein Q8R53_06340 [Nanoarchaeota archaeon]|nr:hypothetical protein [Nanoarchaeota archaeon]
MNPLEIIANAEKVVEDIHNYSRSQKELWQKIPLLALEADGRTSSNGNYYRAYHSGFWGLDNGSDQCRSVYVDLATGELVDAYSAFSHFFPGDVAVPKKSVLKPAREEEVLKLAFNLEELDAKNIVASLEEEAKERYSSYYNLKEQKGWRDELRTKLHLPEFYVR